MQDQICTIHEKYKEIIENSFLYGNIVTHSISKIYLSNHLEGISSMSWLTYALLSTLFVAFSSIFEKLGLRNTDTLLVTTIQSMMTSVFLLVSCIIMRRFTGESMNNLIQNNGWYILVAGTITAFSWLFYVHALKHGAVSKVESVDRLSLLFTILLSALMLGEPLHIKSILGGILMAIGSWLIIIGV